MLKIHLAVYGVLLLLGGVLYAEKNYYQEKYSEEKLANKALTVAFNEKVKEAETLKSILEAAAFEADKIKSDHERALSEISKLRATNVQVKAYLDTPIPSDLNNWLRGKYTGNKVDKTNATTKPVKRVSKAKIRRTDDRRLASACGKLRHRPCQMQLREILIASIL